MKRYQWLCMAAVVALTTVTFSAVASAKPAATQTVSGRVVSDLSLGAWKFHLGDDADPTGLAFDDSGWQAVTIPHTWNRLGAYGTTRPADTNATQGVGWYRLAYKAPASAKGQRQYLDFAGVGEIADVWVNGVHVGQHKGAFARFRFDVTAQWRAGAENIIVVKADNSKKGPTSTTADVLPLAGDFFVYGGIYRGVSLVTTGAQSIDLLDFGGPGVYATTPTVSSEEATVQVLTRVRSAATSSKALKAEIEIKDAQGQTVARKVAPVVAAPGQSEVSETLAVKTPHLWNGTEDPYLYTVQVTLLDGKKPVDVVKQPLGIRTFHFDPNEGFSLNGQHLQLHGVSRHQDRAGKGWALSPEDHQEDMALIKEIGANTVRLAHYEHADEWVTAADEAGMVTWAEVPYVTASSFDGSEGTAAVFENATQQTKELIRQDFNHPSIMMWSVGNEVNASAIYMTKGKPAHPLKLLQAINAVAKAEDTSRPTVFADCCEDSPLGTKKQEPLAGTADMIGYNRYYGWYYGKPGDLGGELDKLHAKHPELPMSVTEYGAGGAVSQNTDNMLGASITAVGRVQPEAYESWYHEESWKQLKDRKYLFATWVWNMFDFASDFRNEGDSVDLNSKGLVSYDRKTKKDAFYFYKAAWSKTPVLYLTDKRYVDRAYPTMSVRAYSNADKARLSVNGEDKGEVTCQDEVCAWPSVTLAPGANKAVVTATVGGQALRDETVWNGPARESGIHLKAGSLLTQTIDGVLFGSDNFFTGGRTSSAGGGFMAPDPKAPPVDPRSSSWRYGDQFSYAIPLANGHWHVTLRTLDPTSALTKPETRMSVKANGAVVVAPFNVLQAAGAHQVGITKTFDVDVTGGVLKLDFIGTEGPAVVSTIEITP